jgi:hypothetical protein
MGACITAKHFASSPSSEDLNRALQLLINQRLFALEAERVHEPRRLQKKLMMKSNGFD